MKTAMPRGPAEPPTLIRALRQGQNRLDVCEGKIELLHKGAGATLLFLHGIEGRVDGQFLDGLSETHQIFAPDHPGFGASDDFGAVTDMSDMAYFYLDLIEDLGLHDIHLVGHSLGAWLAAEIAIRDSSRIRGVSLLAPAGLRMKGQAIGDIFIWSQEETIRRSYFEQALAEEQCRSINRDQAGVRLRNLFAAAKLAWQPRMFSPSLGRWLHRIKVPVQIIWGAEDQVLPSALAEAWRERLPQARVTLIPSCGHLIHVEKTAAVIQLVTGFV